MYLLILLIEMNSTKVINRNVVNTHGANNIHNTRKCAQSPSNVSSVLDFCKLYASARNIQEKNVVAKKYREYFEARRDAAQERVDGEIKKMWNTLSEFQRGIVKEIEEREFRCGVMVPMGSGKTPIGIYCCLKSFAKHKRASCVVCTKTLEIEWMSELEKFCPDIMDCVKVIVSSDGKDEPIVLEPHHVLVIVSGHAPRRSYCSDETFGKRFCWDSIKASSLVPGYRRQLPKKLPGRRPDNRTRAGAGRQKFGDVVYQTPAERPNYKDETYGDLCGYKTDIGIIHSYPWSILIVDEAQGYLNIEDKDSLSRAVCSIYADRRLAMSGTMFKEPRMSNFLGYMLMIGWIKTPITMNMFQLGVLSGDISPVNDTCVFRDNNPDFIDNKGIEFSIEKVVLDERERKFYEIVRKAALGIAHGSSIGECPDKELADVSKVKGSALLVLLNYMRIGLISTDIALERIKQHLGEGRVYVKQILGKYPEILELNSGKVSSRLTRARDIILSHDSHSVVFSSFSCVLTSLASILEKDGCEVYILNSSDTKKVRARKIRNFRSSRAGKLLLTYKIGSEGLNLQEASRVVFIDMAWNNSTMEQAYKRCYRRGQKNKVFVTELVGDTALERRVIEKHGSKLKIVEEIMNTGKLLAHIPKITRADLINILSEEDHETTRDNVSNVRNGSETFHYSVVARV